MNSITWVFGGSCCGKKHFIRWAVEHPGWFNLPAGLQPAWYADGETDAVALLGEQADSPIIVRWQWGRENVLREIAEKAAFVEQRIVLCKCPVSVQTARVRLREEWLKWDDRCLTREAEDVQYLVEQLSMDLGLPVYYVDTGQHYEDRIPNRFDYFNLDKPCLTPPCLMPPPPEEEESAPPLETIDMDAPLTPTLCERTANVA